MRKIPLLLCLLAAAFVTLAAQSLLSLSVTVQGDGEVVKYLDGEETEETQFSYGTTIELEAIPAEGSFFVQWNDGSNTSFFKTIDIEADITTCSAEFHKLDTVKTGVNTVLATYASYQYEGAKGGAKDEEDEEEDDLDDDDVDPEEPDDPEELDEPEGGFEGTPNPNCVFIPTEDGTYSFYTVGDADTYGVLFNSDMEGLEFDDDAGDDLNFKFSYYLEADETYYISAGFLDENIVGDIELHIVHIDEVPSTITVSAEGNGHVGILLNGVSTNETVFDYGTKLVLCAKPNTNNFFVQWNEESTDLEYNITVERDSNYVGKFHEIQKVVKGQNTVLATYGKSYTIEGGGVKDSSKEEEDEEEEIEEPEDPEEGEYGIGTPNPNCVFIPEVSGEYDIFTEGDEDTYGVLFDSDMNHLAWNDDFSRGNNFSFTYELSAGETYYISAGFYNKDTVGDITLQIKAPVTIAVTADEEQGSVSGGGTFPYGESVTVVATAVSNEYEFLRWSDGSTSAEYTFIALEDKELEAIFKPVGAKVYTITAEANDDEMGTVTGSSQYFEGETAVLTASPTLHHHFVKWGDDEGENPRNVLVSSDSIFEAKFAIDQHQLTVLAQNGTSSITTPTMFDWGESVEISVSANEHCHFVKWSDGVEQEVRSITILSDTIVTAICEIDTYTVNVELENGTVNGAEAGEYAWNTTLTLEAVAEEHYHFIKWNDDLTTNPREVTITMDTTLYAEFAIDTFNVTMAETVEHGLVNGLGEYVYGAEVSFEAVADEDYKFVRWTGWTASDNTVNPLVFTVEEDVVLEPLFIDANKDLFKVTVNATDGGTVTGGGEYLTGDKAKLTAVADEGYRFVRWSDVNNNAVTREIEVTRDTTITARFSPRSYEVKVIAGTHGTVTGGQDYAYNTRATITAIPDKGYHFVKWNDGDTNAERIFVVTKDEEFTAEFAINNYTIAATAVANGTVEGDGKFDYGAEVTLTATAAAGYHFVKWSNNETANPYKFAAESDLTLTAEFAINTYEVTATAANGTVEGTGTYNHGAEATLTATAAEGYSFVKWSDGVTDATRKVTVTSALAFTAEFAINSYDVTASATNGAVEGAGKYNYGAEATLTAVANKGYHFVKWSDDVTTETRKVTVKGSQSFTAVFAANTYTVAVTAEANGTVTGAGTYEYGTTATIEAKANDGFRFVKWSDGVKTAKRTVEVVSDTTLTASFAARTYEVAAEARNGKVDGLGTYNKGDEVTLTATANPGYHFVKWVDDTTATNPRTLIVAGDTTVTALFEKEAYVVKVNERLGKIIASSGTLEFGATITLTAGPDSGYQFVMWSDSVLDNPRTVTLTLEMLKLANENGFEFTAIFEKDEVEIEPGTAIDEAAANAVNIFAFGNTIVVENADSDIFVYNAMGRLINRTAAEADRTEIQVSGNGVYIVKTGNTAKRVMIND